MRGEGGIQKRSREAPLTGGGRHRRGGGNDGYGLRSYRQQSREPLFLFVVLFLFGRSKGQLPRGSLRCGKVNDKCHGMLLGTQTA